MLFSIDSLILLIIYLYLILTFFQFLLLILGDIKLPPRVQEAMQMQVEAERKKRAAILESEGIREADRQERNAIAVKAQVQSEHEAQNLYEAAKKGDRP